MAEKRKDFNKISFESKIIDNFMLNESVRYTKSTILSSKYRESKATMFATTNMILRDNAFKHSIANVA